MRNRAGLNFTENCSVGVYGTQKIDSPANSEMRRLEKKMLVDSVAALLLLLPLAGEKRMAPIRSSYVRSALRRIE